MFSNVSPYRLPPERTKPIGWKVTRWQKWYVKIARNFYCTLAGRRKVYRRYFSYWIYADVDAHFAGNNIDDYIKQRKLELGPLKNPKYIYTSRTKG